MNFPRIFGNTVLALVLLAYAGSFMLLPVVHTHHSGLFVPSGISGTAKHKQASSHPDECVVCSRISTSAVLISTVDIVLTGMVFSTQISPFVTPRVSSTSSPVLSGRAPPSFS